MTRATRRSLRCSAVCLRRRGTVAGGGDRRRRRSSDLHEGRGSDLPGEVRSVPSARFDCADVAGDLPRVAALGAVDQGTGVHPPDAAVAYRSHRRDLRVQETTARSATSRSKPSCAGSMAAPPQGNPSDMPAAIDWPDASKWNFSAQFGGPPNLIVESMPYTMQAEANRCVVEAAGRDRADAGALGAGHRDQAGHRGGSPDHASRHRAAGPARERSGAGGGQSGQRVQWRRPLAHCRDVHGMGRWQAGRDHAAGHRQAGCCRTRRFSGTFTTRPRARRSPTPRSWACICIRRIRPPSIVRCCI